MKVLLVNKFHYRKGGSETYYFDVADGLRKLGHEVVFFSMEDPRNEPCDQSGYFVSASDYNGKASVLKKAKEALSIAYNIEAKAKFERLLQNERPDVIHLNLTHRQITFSILDAPGAEGIPVVFTSHDYIMVCPNYLMLDGGGNVCDACLDGSFRHCLEKRCVKDSVAKSALAVHEANFLRKHRVYDKIDRVIAPSEFMRSKLQEGGFPASQVVTMQNFAKDELIARAKEGNTAPKEAIFLFFGRLSKEKGVDVLAKAFLQVVDKLPQKWELIIAGDGPERKNVEGLLRDQIYADRVKMTGFLAKEEMQRYAERASFAIVSSRWRENMPYSVVEAFAAGTPVIASRIGGIPELVMQGDTGFLFKPDDVESLAQAMLQAACMDDVAYARMQRNCRDYVIERCGQNQYMNNLVALYERLISEKKAR